MLMAAVVPRDTVVTYKPPRGTKVNLSTADHVTLADTGDALLRTCKGGDPLHLSEDELSPLQQPLNAQQQQQQQSVRGYVVASKGGCSSPSSSLPSPASAAGASTGITSHLVTAELNHSSTGSLSSLRHANSNGSVASLARAAITRANTLRSSANNSCPLKSSTSSSAALNRTGSLVRRHESLSRTASLNSEAEDRRRTSILSTATEEINLAIPLDGDEEEEEEQQEVLAGAGEDPRLTIVRSNSLNSLAFTPVIVSQQPPRLDQHGGPRPISPLPPTSIQLRRSGAMPDRARRANYRSTKNVSFDCETRTETFETELTESETDEREFVRLMGHYERRPHMRLPLSPDDEYCPPGKEEEDLLPKVLCFALALIITGGILYGLNLLISRMNMNLFSS